MRTTVSTGRTHLKINRTKPFDPEDFLDQPYWLIWCGPVNRDGFKGKPQQCVASLALVSIDLAKVRLVACLKGKEIVVNGEEFLHRLKRAKHLRLDAQVLQALLQNQHLIPDAWKKVERVCFMGTELLLAPSGQRYVLFLKWNGTEWCFGYERLTSDFGADTPAAVGGV